MPLYSIRLGNLYPLEAFLHVEDGWGYSCCMLYFSYFILFSLERRRLTRRHLTVEYFIPRSCSYLVFLTVSTQYLALSKPAEDYGWLLLCGQWAERKSE